MTRITLITTVDRLKIADIITKDKDHTDHYFWKFFLDDVTTVLNYDAPSNIDEYKWRITGARDISYVDKDVLYSSFLDPSNEEVCVELLEFLSDPRELEKFWMTLPTCIPIPTFMLDLARSYSLYPSRKVTSSVGTASLTRPSSGRREFKGNFNTETATGASPRAVSWPVEVRRDHVGIHDGDWYCYDCDGYVWGSKVECDNKKCQRRCLGTETSVYGMGDSPSRPMERELSMSYTPPVDNERAELKDTSFVLNDLQDTSSSTDNSSVTVYARSGE